MLIGIDKRTKLIVGIYEIPYGIIALLVGKIKRIPVMLISSEILRMIS